MSYNTKNTKEDASGDKIPQYFNTTSDDYEDLQGRDGAGYVEVIKPIPAGNNNIGNIDLASAIPSGSNEIGKVKVNSQLSSFVTGTKTVTDSAVELYADASKLSNRTKISFYIEGSSSIWIGADNDVTTDDGYEILPGRENEEIIEFDPNTTVEVWAIAETDESITVRIREVN